MPGLRPAVSVGPSFQFSTGEPSDPTFFPPPSHKWSPVLSRVFAVRRATDADTRGNDGPRREARAVSNRTKS